MLTKDDLSKIRLVVKEEADPKFEAMDKRFEKMEKYLRKLNKNFNDFFKSHDKKLQETRSRVSRIEKHLNLP